MSDRVRAQEELSRCIIQLLLKEPFFGHLLASVVRSATEDTPTAAVALLSSGVQLRVNPTFFLKTVRRQKERIGVVKHECLHLLFKHLFRFDDRRDAYLFNIAADLVVNQFVRPWPLPGGAVTLATFPDLDLPKDKTADWYYDRLMQLKQGKVDAPESGEALERLYGSRWHSDHDHWADGELSDEVKRAVETDLDRAIVAAKDRSGPRAWGKLPGPLQRLVQAILERRKPKVDWRRAMRLFAASSRRTRVVGTNKRESRRYAQIVEDRYVPGIKVKSFSRLAVAVDTSGSVPDHDLERFFAEIHGMWRAGAEVVVIESDAAVQRVWTYRGQLPEAVGGRGGTAFDPVFSWLRDDRTRKWDGCIYLTDGGAPEPTVRPPCKLLWVVTADGWTGDHLTWGRVIQLPMEGA